VLRYLRPTRGALSALALLVLATAVRGQDALPAWSEEAQKAWWAANPTLAQEASAANDLHQQLALAYKSDGTAVFARSDFQNWLDLYEWIKLGLDSGKLLASPANFQTFVTVGQDTRVSHLLVEKIEPADVRPQALAILLRLAQANLADLHEYAALGVAYCLVFDAPFPADWPHFQVAPDAVPIGNTDPVQRFQFYVAANRAHKCELDLSQQSFENLKFLVDSKLSFSELAYGQQETSPYSDFVEAFFSINYATLRVDGNDVMNWNAPTYRLQDIKAIGGICIDQSYYAAMVGKARGIPTMMLTGLGDVGAHAWFGYLDHSGAWELDCGRYNQNYAKGYTRDPQTWQELKDTDWEQFVKNGVNDPNYPAAHAALSWARLLGDAPEARTAYDDARTIMPAWAEAWQAEADYLDRTNVTADDAKSFYDAWITEMAPYPDQKVAAERRLVATLRKAGDPSADSVEQDIILQNRTGGIDLAVDGTLEALDDHFKAADYDGARLEFERSVRDFGETGGGTFFYRIVEPYIRNCWQHGQVEQAQNGLQFTQDRTALDTSDPGNISQINEEFDKLKARQADIHDGVAAIQSWLGELDSGQADQAWSEAEASLGGSAAEVAAVRQKAGNMTARSVTAVAQYEHSPGGAGGETLAGPFVAARFTTVFDSATLLETAVARKTGDHAWKISSYAATPFVAPAPATAAK
jgi:hypothetical protein